MDPMATLLSEAADSRTAGDCTAGAFAIFGFPAKATAVTPSALGWTDDIINLTGPWQY